MSPADRSRAAKQLVTCRGVRRKKFADEEYLQKSYAQICEKYNVSTKQAREALIVLEKLGVVKRHFRTIETEMGKCPNVMYILFIR